MNKQAVYDIWAPSVSPWSAWAKPTVFSHMMPEAYESTELAPYEVSLLPSADERRALVLDLPGVDSIRAALALAARGYRPVPLFNACPAPPVAAELVFTAVEVGPILAALCAGAHTLAESPLPTDAPPVFLLDANRAAATRTIAPGTFDNRSVAFASDFPSATFLRQQRIHSCLVVHSSELPVADDLRHALRHWAAAGLPIDVISPSGEPIEVTWPKNGFFGELAVRLFAFFRLRQNPQGGYGAFVPESSGG